MALLEAKQLGFTYPNEQQPAINNIDISIEEGEFIVICGPSGSGKSTLLRLFKQEVSPHGKLDGSVLFQGKLLSDLGPMEKAKNIGMVFQDPENQLVMDRVFEELVFGLENMGISTPIMRKKVAEMVHFFGINSLLSKKVHLLSGGQKQTVNLASVLLMEPKILLLDEPTSQLDPVAAKDFLNILKQMNEEFGITVIIVEHRLEEVFPLADRVFVLDEGKLYFEGTPKEVISTIWKRQHQSMFGYLPSTALLYLEHTQNPDPNDIPLTVKEGKQWVKQMSNVARKDVPPSQDISGNAHPILSVKNVSFQYEKYGEKILNSLSLSVKGGEWLSIVGANGTGKSTLLKIIAGLEHPQRGTVKYNGKKLKKANPFEVAYLPQNPKLLFVHDTVQDHFLGTIERLQIQDGKEKLKELSSLFQINPLMERHPYDVSGGEMQKIGLATILLSSPKVLLLDEPTKGLDPEMKKQLGHWLKELQRQGLTIVMVTHDIEFAASFGNECAMMFQGEITAVSPTSEFFRGNSFYTTVINRITRGNIVPEVLTVEEARVKWMA